MSTPSHYDAEPNPFQLDDTDESDTSSEAQSEPDRLQTRPPLRSVDSGLLTPQREDIPLGSTPPPTKEVRAFTSQDRKKDTSPVHPPPLASVADEVPALFLPGLINPSLFLPIPNSDQLSILLNKYIAPESRPQRDLTGAWQHSDVPTLVMANSWRALARMSRDRIVNSNPDDIVLIFEFWHLRLTSLTRLRLFNQAAAECNNLFAILRNIQPDLVRTYIFDSLLPFELEVMYARTRYWAGDPYGYLDELYALLRTCKKRSKTATIATDVEMWKERAVRVGLIMASQLLEMKDHTAAAALLLPLCHPTSPDAPPPSLELLSAVARIYLDSGDIGSAEELIKRIENDPTCEETMKEINRALLASARLDWQTAVDNLRSAIHREPDNALVANNLSVVLLSTGNLQEGIHHMETALKTSPEIVGSVEPFLFNLATLYELRTAANFDKKCGLLLEIAQWASDGLRVNCLKLPQV
ncbi:hypothetical protein FRB95_009504 [Tulasnella sp. JGI-2019a]|nr:hypothetical protein FRB93_012579 [Tulasnella sp. JGI-2019a]KAG9026021.1 hypothetical protein FRB95_009504 [Tulasnella sp. JGI-2019a]